ncbi:MAG: PAS domain S-box protein [Oryzomonas sp.]|uniref:PAS domain S-box protein n=1 Tax=Oryzomonas sp. TaxID=2855186 RepID=UPI00284BC56E|nr:PAS domain S-box protein [Oryzomonas sp.]MDR3581596.1 PAS domain S-box protein [Oryzomonas sp.]
MKFLLRLKKTSIIRFRLACVVLVAVLPVCLITGFLVIHSYNSKCNQVAKNMLETAQSLSMGVDLELSSIQAALLALATSPSFASGDFGSVHRQALELLKLYPGADIIVADVTGQQVVNSASPYGLPLPKRNNPETVRRIFETGKPVISDQFYGALTKTPLISIDIPVMRGGKVAYDLAMTLPSSRIVSVLLQHQFPPGWYGTILDSKSVVVARSGYPEKYVGKRVNSALYRAIIYASEGVVDTTNNEGVPILASFHRSAKSSWGVVVWVPKSSVMAGIYQWVRWVVAGSFVLSLFGVAVALGIGQRIVRAENALRLSEERFRGLVEQAPEGIFVADAQGRYLDVNPAGAQMLGYTQEEICRMGIADVLALEEVARLPEKVARLAGGTVDRNEWRFKRKDGSFFIGEVVGRQLPDGRLQGILRDVTVNKQAEAMLKNMNKELELRVAERTHELAKNMEMLKIETSERIQILEALREKERMLIQQSRQAAMGEMIGNIAHQWRQPLNVLGLQIQQLQVFYDLGLFNKEFLDNNVTGSMEIIQHMSKTIDDFRNYFKPDKEKTEFNVHESIKSSLSLLEGSLRNPLIDVEVIADDDPAIYGFPNEFAQVILNIVNNARDVFIERNVRQPKVNIKICSEGRCVVVTVADNAGGIPEDIINKVFDPYFTTKGPQQGTGIGLFMSKVIIEKNMGGRLNVRNTDNGAEFRIELQNGIDILPGQSIAA